MTNNLANIMTVQALLSGKHDGFDKSDKIKMIRMKSDREKILIGGNPQTMELRDIYKYHRDQFEEYFKEETNPIFDGVEYVVVFLAEDGTDSRLVGVYENQGKDPLRLKTMNLHYYNLVAVNEFEFLKDRVIVDWGLHHEQWHQWWKNNKYVTRIDGYTDKNVPIFDSYADVMLNYSELKAVIYGNDEVWKRSLQSVNCIYGIVDKSNGRIYIGSTYGATGIYGRWKDYADNTGKWYGVELKKWIKDNPDHIHKLQWIILEVLPLKVSEEKAVRRESFYKEKFCSRLYGYNKN